MIKLQAFSGRIRDVLSAVLATVIISTALGGDGYHLRLERDGTVIVSNEDGAEARFRPEFNVLFAEKDPQMATRWGEYVDGGLRSGDQGSTYHVLTWGRTLEAVGASGHVADGYDPTTDRFYGPDRSPNLFKAAPRSVRRLVDAQQVGDRIIWRFGKQDGVQLEAELSLPVAGGPPTVVVKAEVERPGWYSFGYVGAPACSPEEMEEVWQPLIYTGRRFPEQPFLEGSGRCPLPTTLVTHRGVTVGVMGDPGEMSFQPMPTLANSRFGVAVRNNEGMAQPMLFAPILGGTGSKLQKGQSFTFTHRLIVTRKNIDATQEHLARTLFAFADIRHNILGSLNTTFENMLAFGLSEHARFNPDLRGFAYDTDVPGSVKNVSALHPLSLALVTDNRKIFSDLAYPLIEYFVSRERFLFTTDPSVKGQSASARLGGDGAPLSEYATLYRMTGSRTPYFRDTARSLFGKDRVLNLVAEIRGDFWANSLAIYRATGESQWLERAKHDADNYVRRRIDTRPKDFEDPDSRGMFFWTSFAPQWIELFELYEETGEPRYLEAARLGARNYTRYIWFSPRIPAETVTVNEGGYAPSYRSGPSFPRLRLAEEQVPAWQVSEVGLTPESSGTSRGHRGILLANYAPWMLRIAALTNDLFLRDVARSAIVGRYTSFPGYHLNTARTTAYQKPDFAERPKQELNAVTSIHFNHIWPHISLVLDYLVSDVHVRSQGRIAFPNHYAEGYAYLQQKVYGDRPGKFYDLQHAYLWMPPGVVQVEHPELNYVVARADGAVAIAFANQSKEPVRSTVRLDAGRIGLPGNGQHAAVMPWQENRARPGYALRADGTFEVEVAPEGITAVVIRGVEPRVEFQAGLLETKASPLPAEGSTHIFNYRGARAVGLALGGPEGTTVYAYIADYEREVERCTLYYRQGHRTYAAMIDKAFPFEFTVPVQGSDPMELYFEVTLKDGRSEKSPIGTVRLKE